MTNDTTASRACRSTVSLLPIAVATNQPPIISPRIRAGATFDTSERPIGLSINSPSEITM